MQLRRWFLHRKYELLLAALLQHLFAGLLISDMTVYRNVIWPLNMVLLGLASAGLFTGKGFMKNTVRAILFALVLGLPLGLQVFRDSHGYFLVLSIVYIAFFAFLFYEILRFLISPGYINADVISASACGYFLLIELCVFVMQMLYYHHPASFKGVSDASHSYAYMDFVYFASITITSIGYGDITPQAHAAKLASALFGIAGQFYTVVLVGIIISKFASTEKNA